MHIEEPVLNSGNIISNLLCVQALFSFQVDSSPISLVPILLYSSAAAISTFTYKCFVRMTNAVACEPMRLPEINRDNQWLRFSGAIAKWVA